MPKWGLTEAQIRAEPWGIASEWLAPLKTITDPIHGDVYVNRLEAAILDGRPMQRLRRVRQLGTAHLVYPGATHSRFSHSLGAVRAAQDLLDAVVDARTGPHPAEDHLSEWDREDVLDGLTTYDRELARVTVLARLGALLHDLTHIPFGHTIEDDLRILPSHDGNGDRFDRLWSEMPAEVQEVFAQTDADLREQLMRLVVSKRDDKQRPPDDYTYPFVADIVGNTICADLIDYLERDHRATGLPFAVGDRFKNDFYVSPTSEKYFPRRMVIRITRGGQERHDVVTELLKYLRYRYELSERVLIHHAKLAADAMIGKLLEMWADALWVHEVAARAPALVDAFGRDAGSLRMQYAKSNPATSCEDLDSLVSTRIENELLRRGDDGFLEYLRDWASDAADSDGRKRGILELSSGVLDRALFKPIGYAAAASDRALAGRLFDEWKDRDKRRQLEESAARCAGLDRRWQCVIWIPAPKMRLKVAEVLVDQDGRINQLDRVGNERARDIYRAHEQLWSVSVFAHADVASDARTSSILLAFLGEELGLRLSDKNGDPIESLRSLAAVELARERKLDHERTDKLREIAANAEIAAHDGLRPTFEEIKSRVLQLGKAEDLLA
jgi:hypothetical protein